MDMLIMESKVKTMPSLYFISLAFYTLPFKLIGVTFCFLRACRLLGYNIPMRTYNTPSTSCSLALMAQFNGFKQHQHWECKHDTLFYSSC